MRDGVPLTLNRCSLGFPLKMSFFRETTVLFHKASANASELSDLKSKAGNKMFARWKKWYRNHQYGEKNFSSFLLFWHKSMNYSLIRSNLQTLHCFQGLYSETKNYGAISKSVSYSFRYLTYMKLFRKVLQLCFHHISMEPEGLIIFKILYPGEK